MIGARAVSPELGLEEDQCAGYKVDMMLGVSLVVSNMIKKKKQVRRSQANVGEQYKMQN